MTEAKQTAPKAAKTEAAPTKGKSIVDPKFRDKCKGDDWMGEFIKSEATLMVDKKVTETKGDEKVTKTIKAPGGVDVDALFKLAEKNHVDVSKYEAQKDSHGFAGRFRMTLSNILRARAAKAHGVFNKGGTWVSAPTDWLKARGAPESPTHDRKGVKIPVPKADKPATEAKETAKS